MKHVRLLTAWLFLLIRNDSITAPSIMVVVIDNTSMAILHAVPTSLQTFTIYKNISNSISIKFSNE